MVGFVILLFVMISIWAILLGSADTSEISNNWAQYRCQPTVMPFASFFGHDTTENFNFCLKGIMNNTAGPLLSPIFTILGSFLGVITNLMNVANSLRLQFATFLGGVNTIFQNFADRFKQLTFKIQMTAAQMKQLIGRLYATFFALIYMSMSGIRAMENFGDTVLFKFLDTFCFDPDTLVDIEGKGRVPVKQVEIGDIFTKTGSRVTSTFRFRADGQPMVKLPGEILVSTNHFIQLPDSSFARAEKHPLAVPAGDWSGGSARPLICFNTSTHTIPVGDFIFADYDETEDADNITMNWIEHALNATASFNTFKTFSYTTVFDPSIRIRMADGSLSKVKDLVLHANTSQGRVIGIVKKEVSLICISDTGERISPGLLLWKESMNKWIRAGDLYRKEPLKTPEIFMNVIIAKGKSVETANGSVFRDYVEVHSPEAETFYAQAMTTPSSSKSE
jgi:hypothetical protein